jgi:hypothetical protein
VGIGRQVRRERLIHRLKERNKRRLQELARTDEDLPTVSLEERETLPPTPPTKHHYISTETRQKVEIPRWLSNNKDDPAVHVSFSLRSLWYRVLTLEQEFLPRLKNHLLSRLLEQQYDGDELDFTAADRRNVVIAKNTIYRHKVLRVNYTTYDLRRAQDSINPRVPGHGDIMVLSPENDEDNQNPHPYWYARILGIYHADVRHVGPISKSDQPQRMEFLFVRWFGRDFTPEPGWKAKRLLRLGFVPGNDGSAFGFLDPAQVIRAIHLIPAFAWGHTSKYLSGQRSVIARGLKDPDNDWQLYYVNM